MIHKIQKKRRYIVWVMCLFILTVPIQSNAGIFGFIKDIFKTGTAVANQVAYVMNMSYLVKEYSKEQQEVLKYVSRGDVVLAKSSIWFTENELKELKAMKNSIDNDIKMAEKADWEFLNSLLDIKIAPDASLSRSDKAEINDYIQKEIDRIRGYRFDAQSFITYVQCCAQKERIKVGAINYRGYRSDAITELEKIYKKHIK